MLILVTAYNRKHRQVYSESMPNDDWDDSSETLRDFKKSPSELLFDNIENLLESFDLSKDACKVTYNSENEQLEIVYFEGEDCDDGPILPYSKRYMDWTKDDLDMWEINILLDVKFLYEFAVNKQKLVNEMGVYIK
jgi:hypothetical protein